MLFERVPNPNKQALLEEAVEEGNTEVATFLVAKGADLMRKNDQADLLLLRIK